MMNKKNRAVGGAPIVESRKKSLGIYVHIPFCRSKCEYCDFYSIPGARSKELMTRYLDAVIAHIRESAPCAVGYEVRSGILQYFNRFDIRGRNIIQTVYFKTVENNQRTVVLCDRAAAAYQNLNFRIGRTIDRRHLYARQFTDNSFGCRSCLHFFQNLSRHTGDRTGKITSFLSTVTNNDYIFQHTGRLSHVYINTRSTTLQRFFHFFHTYKTDFQNSLVHIRNVCQCEFAIQIRSTTQCRTLYNHSGADYRTIVVGHRTCYGGSLCHCTDRYHQQSKYAYD